MADVAEQNPWAAPVPSRKPARIKAGGWVGALAAFVAIALGAGAATALADHVPASSGFGGRRGFPPGFEFPPGFGPNGGRGFGPNPGGQNGAGPNQASPNQGVPPTTIPAGVQPGPGR